MRIINEMVVRSVLAYCILGISQVALAEQRVLNADEVTAMFSDKTVWGEHAFKPKKSIVYLSSDGTYKSRRLDVDETNEGKWSVNKKGELCMKNKKEKCRKVVDEDGVIKKYKKKKHVWTYTKFEEGNNL